MTTPDSALELIAQTIREVINEDWVAEFDIDESTRFNEDLEMESIEFLKVAAALQKRYGQQIDIQKWLSGKTIHELISLSVGDLAAYIEQALQGASHG